MSGRLAGKYAVVTGGARGIGRAIVLAFAREGAHVAVADVAAEDAQHTVREVGQLGRRGLWVSADVSRKASIDALFSTVLDAFGRIDIAVCNAGIHLAADFLEVSEEVFDRTLDTNLKGQFFCAQAAARHMVERGGGGKIIITSSVSAEIADPGASHYCVGKGGSQMLMRSAALELAQHDIQVNAIAPGTIKTTITPWYDTQDAVDYCRRLVPAQRFGRTEELAGAAVYLASDESSYTTGATIAVDGGLLIQ